MIQFQSTAEVEQLVADFEACRLPPHGFNHHRHLAVAMWYRGRLREDDACEKMRQGLMRFLRHHHAGHARLPQVYNETITVFWIKLLGHVLDVRPEDEPLHESVNWAVGHFGTMWPVFAHYSRERVFSQDAKALWVEPDLVPLTF